MDIEIILNELKKNFQLKENHVSIIRILNKNNLTAGEICSKTGIPKGRIYNLLNELINLRLIQKKKGIPSYYSVEDIEANTLKFLRGCFDNLLERQLKIMSLLSKEEQKIEVAIDKEKCIFCLREALSKDDDFRVVFGSKSVPFFFYPEDDKKHLMIRKELSKKRETFLGGGHNSVLVRDSYMEACKRGKTFKFLITEEAFKLHMNLLSKVLKKSEFQKIISNIKRYLKQYSIGLRVMSGYIFNYIYATNSRIFIVFFSPSIVTGLLLRSDNAVSAFSELFDDVYKRSHPIERYLDVIPDE